MITRLSARPSFSRMPPSPSTQPASSRVWRAASGSYCGASTSDTALPRIAGGIMVVPGSALPCQALSITWSRLMAMETASRTGGFDLAGRLLGHIGDQVDIAGLEGEQPGSGIGVEAEGDLTDAGSLAPVVRVGLDGVVIGGDVFDLAERTGADA